MMRINFGVLLAAFILPMPAVGQTQRARLSGLTIDNIAMRDSVRGSRLQQFKIPSEAAIFRSNAAVCGLPFFCRQELHFEQHTGVPLRLRLGSVNDANWLEGKPGATLPR